MKANELMIGDWVQYDRSYPPMGTMKAIQVTLQDLIDISQWNECDPIPLTAEILEKNGWVKGVWWYLSDDCPFSLIKYYENSWAKGKWGVRFNPEDSDPSFLIGYVHELQHALRLCGLNDLADNFKIQEE